MVIDLSIIFNSWYSFITLFLLIVSSSFFPIPGISILIASYASFANNINDLLFIISLTLIASLAGDLATYFLARKFSNKGRDFLAKFKWYHKNEERVYKSLNAYEFSFVFFTRFLVSGSGPLVNYLSGFEKLNARKFITAVFLGESVYSIGCGLIGYIFKDTWNEIISLVQNVFLAIVLAAIGIYLLYKIIKFYKNQKNPFVYS